ncbi:MAG: AAA family ATPase [Okeania sp. SIO3B3]|nr:AAA family ATPase [Okeania sp. SIO3B3]
MQFFLKKSPLGLHHKRAKNSIRQAQLPFFLIIKQLAFHTKDNRHEMIPELERIIGEQPPVPELSGSAAQNRFNLLFQKFIQVFATQSHPLVIFIDDLQWADLASLNLLKLLMSNSEAGYLLLLGAYRDNEVFPAHPLMLTLDEIDKLGVPLNSVTLAPLSQGNLNRLVADTLSCSPKLALPLTELVHQKTKGNPFFATQFLKGLHEDGWIVFNFDVGHWQCDLTRVRYEALSDNVVDFMVTRLHKLPETTQEVLKLAACIGNQFDLATLAVVSEQSEIEVASCLWVALQEALVLPVSDTYKFFQDTNHEKQEHFRDISVGYKFLHDRVQQAAYCLIPEMQKQVIHYRIGKRLLLNLSVVEREERIFDIVNQINIGQTSIEDEIEKKQLIELNFSAGQKAKTSTAYDAAKTYFKVGIDLLLDNSWTTNYDLAFQLHLALAEAQLMSVDFDSLEKTIAILLECANSPLDRAKIYVLKVNQYSLQGPYSEAIKAGLAGLQELGTIVKQETLKESIQQESLVIEKTLEKCSITSLLDLPTATDPAVKVEIELLMNLLSASYISSNIDLYGFTIVRNLRLSLEYGNIPKSITAYVNYGEWLGLIKNEYQEGVKFADLALQLSYKFNSKSQQSSACFLLGGCIHVKAKPIQGAAEINYQGFLAGMDSGELQYAGYNLFANIYNRLFQGENLDEIVTDLDKYWSIAEKIQNDLALSVLSACRFFINKLAGNPDRQDSSCISTQEQAWIERHQASQSYLPLGIYYILQMHEACLKQGFAQGVDYRIEARKFLTACSSCTTAIGYYYYSSLNFLGLYSSLSEVERKDVLEQIETNQERLKILYQSCPENFLHKYLLVKAERSRVEGNRLEAMELYDRAITEAKENHFLQEEALANELAAKFYLEWGKEKIAPTYMQQAYYCYARWGAKTKVEDLEKLYPTLLTPILEKQKFSSLSSATLTSLTQGTIPPTTTGTGEILDLATLMKASQTLSEDISLEGAIANLMQVVRENAGAETVALMLFTDQVLMLTAIVSVQETLTCHPVPVATTHAVPLSVVNQVKHSQKPLVIDNASHNNVYAGDAYIQKHQPQSVLCLPLIDHGNTIGILYLENNQVAGAFTSERVEVLTLLCSQAAISLENARLYQESQNYAQTLEQTQLQLVQSEKMASIGQLVSGIAHEINNPVGFIGGNLDYATEYIQDLMDLLQLYQEGFENNSQTIQNKIEEIELDYLLTDLPELIESMKQGTERIAEISKSMRTFSRADTIAKVPFNIHDGINSTLLILRHRLKANELRPEIKVVKNYGNLPEINCYPGQLNQVFMNLIANAIDALEESNSGKTFAEIKAAPNQITITTKIDSEKQQAIITIGDNGMGMSEEMKKKIFEHLFTTKGVGKGTGLGLSISRQIVEEKHGGKITCTSELGIGTEFVIALAKK